MARGCEGGLAKVGQPGTIIRIFLPFVSKWDEGEPERSQRKFGGEMRHESGEGKSNTERRRNRHGRRERGGGQSALRQKAGLHNRGAHQQVLADGTPRRRKRAPRLCTPRETRFRAVASLIRSAAAIS